MYVSQFFDGFNNPTSKLGNLIELIRFELDFNLFLQLYTLPCIIIIMNNYKSSTNITYDDI